MHKIPYNGSIEHNDPSKFKIIPGTVWEHTMASLRLQTESNKPELNLAILFHDIGKPYTFSENETGIHYYNHSIIGVDVINQVAARLKFSNELKDILTFCCLNHMKMHFCMHSKERYNLANLINDDKFIYLLKVTEYDTKSRLHAFKQEEWNEVLIAIYKIISRFTYKPISYLKKIINGDLIMTECKITKPNQQIGQIQTLVIKKIIRHYLDLTPEIIKELINEAKINNAALWYKEQQRLKYCKNKK